MVAGGAVTNFAFDRSVGTFRPFGMPVQVTLPAVSRTLELRDAFGEFGNRIRAEVAVPVKGWIDEVPCSGKRKDQKLTQ